MYGMNEVNLIGHFGEKLEVSTTQGGRTVARFSVATDQSYKNAQGEKVERTEWHRIETWNPNDIQRLQRMNGTTGNLKGKLVNVRGSLRTTKYTVEGEAKDRFSTVIVIDFNGHFTPLYKGVYAHETPEGATMAASPAPAATPAPAANSTGAPLPPTPEEVAAQAAANAA